MPRARYPSLTHHITRPLVQHENASRDGYVIESQCHFCAVVGCVDSIQIPLLEASSIGTSLDECARVSHKKGPLHEEEIMNVRQAIASEEQGLCFRGRELEDGSSSSTSTASFFRKDASSDVSTGEMLPRRIAWDLGQVGRSVQRHLDCSLTHASFCGGISISSVMEYMVC